MVATSGGHWTGTFHVDDSPAGEGIRQFVEKLTQLITWVWDNKEVLYQVDNNPDLWALIEIWKLISLWFWTNRQTFYRAALVVIGLGELVNAGLDGCAACWDGWVGIWRPLGVMRGAV